MTPENFCYWLQGFHEIHGRAPTPDEWKVIVDHLTLVFHKVTPVYPPNQFTGLQWDPSKTVTLC